MRINLYGQNRHVVVINGIAMSGFKEGDYIQIKADGNAATRTHGGDGPSMNLSSKQGGQVTIGLNPTSPLIGQLYALREQQASNPYLFDIQILTGVEELISASGCMFGDLPQFSTGGDKMQGRDFMFEALRIDMDLSAVESALGAAISTLV
jgi:hypothetical protein